MKLRHVSKDFKELKGNLKLMLRAFVILCKALTKRGNICARFDPSTALRIPPPPSAHIPYGVPELAASTAGCYFVEKAYHAQQAGAKAVLVYDDREESLLTMAAPEDKPEIAKLRDEIEIPTSLIPRVSLPKRNTSMSSHELARHYHCIYTYARLKQIANKTARPYAIRISQARLSDAH